MHAVIQRLILTDPYRRDETVRRLTQGLLPDLKAGPEVGECHLVVSEGLEIVCVALFDHRSEAETGAELIETWTQRHLVPLVDAGRSVIVGEVVRS